MDHFPNSNRIQPHLGIFPLSRKFFPNAGLVGVLAFLGLLYSPSDINAQTGRWIALPDTTAVLPREECAFAQAGGRFYLIGGRARPVVQEFNPNTKTWKSLKTAPTTLNHFQALTSAGLIYVICAFDESKAGYPSETPAPNVLIYDPLSDTWITGPAIPTDRKRGSAGLVEYNKKFYVVLGNKLGHSGPGAPYLDEFDPSTNTWTALPDAPRFRDHFQAAVVNGKIYAMGGRQSINQVPNFTDLEKVDVYNFASGVWSTLPSPASDMKTKRSGAVVVPLGSEILFAGGSNPDLNSKGPFDSVNAFNTINSTWRSVAPMKRARQVTGGFINNSGLYTASGSGGIGGSPTLKSMEVFFLNDSLPPTGDALTAGKLAPTDTIFNLGIVQSGQSATRRFFLRHVQGNQGVLVSGFKITGDAGFQVKTLVTAPFLVRPGDTSTVELAFTSAGSAPAQSYLEVSYAVPPGITLKIPLDANRTPASLVKPMSRKHSRSSETPEENSIRFGRDEGNENSQGEFENQSFWDALGKQVPESVMQK